MRSVLTMLAGVVCASVAMAQAGTTTRTDTSSTTTTTYQRITTVVGQPFMLGTESVGKVVDVVFNSSGCIEYVLVQDAEGFIVVPFGVVTVSTEQKGVVIRNSTVTVDQLREVRFAEGRLPNFSDTQFTQRMTRVWGAEATRPRSGAGSGAGTAPGKGATSPDRKDAGTTTPDRKGGTTTPDRKDPGTTNPDRKDPGTRTPPDRKNTDPPAKGTTPPRGTDDPPAKTDPKNPPKKDKDKDGR